MSKERIFDILGYVGIGLIQGATFPSMIQFIISGTGDLPPLTMTLMIWAGLMLFLLRSFQRRDMVAIVSNAIGFFLQTVMLGIITLGA